MSGRRRVILEIVPGFEAHACVPLVEGDAGRVAASRYFS